MSGGVMADASAQQPAEVATTTTELSLLDQVLVETKITPCDEGYDLARRGVAAFLAELVKPERADGMVNNALIDQMIAEIDRKISAQLDAVLHTDEFQKLESAWRGLKFLVDRTDFRQNIKVELLSVSKDELLTDFEDSPEIVKSGLYKLVYSAEFGQFGGQPVAAMISAYEFGSSSQDVKLMRYMSAVGAMSHSPVIASAGPEMFGVERHEEIANLKDLQSIFEGPKYAKWNSFRESEDARYFGLTLPRFLLRLPYGPGTIPVKSFNYQEASDGETVNYLWGSGAFAFATRLTESFAKYRWCPNIIGPQSGGAIEDLNLHTYESMGQLQSKVPTEVLISDRREFELAEQGFIALTMRKGSDNAAFFSANSVQKPKYFGNTQEGKTAELNYKLGTQLPYMFIINRFAHYIKVLQRENIGSWKSREELQSELNDWIRQYVSDQQNPSADVRSRRPLRKAEIAVEDVDGEPGWYRVGISVVPHLKYMGADFALTLKGRLDKQ
ncbi:type VI secretion system contractile sheath large subunit [Bradyrhizobium sp. UFLA05-112]